MVYKKSKIKVLLGPERDNDIQSKELEQSADVENIQVRSSSVRRPIENRSDVFEKIGETNVYKRTRPFKAFQGRPTLDRYPSNLELSGHKVEHEDDKLKSASARDVSSAKTQLTVESVKIDTMDKATDSKPSARSRDSQASAEGRYSPSLPKSRHGRTHSSASNVVSRNVLTDFGLRTSRTDTFSGHQRHRGASADLERQMEERAERHIRTCQVVGTVKRSSRAQRSFQGLKDTVSPLHASMTFYPGDRHNKIAFTAEKSFIRSDSNLNKGNVMPYMIQIRKSVGSVSRMKSIGPNFHQSPRPELSGRTLIVGTSIGLS